MARGDSGNGAAASIWGGIITLPEEIPGQGVPNTGFNACGKFILQAAWKSVLVKVDLSRK